MQTLLQLNASLYAGDGQSSRLDAERFGALLAKDGARNATCRLLDPQRLAA
jgi:hypothetical protein